MKKKDGSEHPFGRGPGLAPQPEYSEDDFPKLCSANELKYLSVLGKIVKWALETDQGTAAAEVTAIITKNLPELLKTENEKENDGDKE